jgi:hypothetical protein
VFGNRVGAQHRFGKKFPGSRLRSIHIDPAHVT